MAFGKIHAKNKMLVEASERMGCKASALLMKISNLASVDPEYLKTGGKELDSAGPKPEYLEYHRNKVFTAQ